LSQQTPRQKRAAGATSVDIKGKIVEYSFWMLKQGYAESTIENRRRFMETLMKRGANLFDPESVKEVIAKQKTWSDNTKSIVVDAYDIFATLNNLTWEPPTYHKTESLPFIPLESEVDQLIAGCGKKVAVYLQTLKETAMRPGEAWRLKWVDVDNERRLISLNKPEKNSNPRMWKVSEKLMTMLNRLPKKSKHVFATNCQRSFKQNFRAQRKSVARKLANPRILQITMYTLRHWKATMLYHQTKDILHVMKFLGHKNIKNTLLYVTIDSTIFGLEDSDEFTVKVAETLKDACDLLEAGFEYVTDMDGKKIFRKRK
jgi:integrase